MGIFIPPAYNIRALLFCFWGVFSGCFFCLLNCLDCMAIAYTPPTCKARERCALLHFGSFFFFLVASSSITRELTKYEMKKNHLRKKQERGGLYACSGNVVICNVLCRVFCLGIFVCRELSPFVRQNMKKRTCGFAPLETPFMMMLPLVPMPSCLVCL